MELGNFAVGNTVAVQVSSAETLLSFTSRVTQVDIFGLGSFGVVFENGAVLHSSLADLDAGLVTSQLA